MEFDTNQWAVVHRLNNAIHSLTGFRRGSSEDPGRRGTQCHQLIPAKSFHHRSIFWVIDGMLNADLIGVSVVSFLVFYR